MGFMFILYYWFELLCDMFYFYVTKACYTISSTFAKYEVDQINIPGLEIVANEFLARPSTSCYIILQQASSLFFIFTISNNYA